MNNSKWNKGPKQLPPAVTLAQQRRGHANRARERSGLPGHERSIHVHAAGPLETPQGSETQRLLNY